MPVPLGSIRRSSQGDQQIRAYLTTITTAGAFTMLRSGDGRRFALICPTSWDNLAGGELELLVTLCRVLHQTRSFLGMLQLCEHVQRVSVRSEKSAGKRLCRWISNADVRPVTTEVLNLSYRERESPPPVIFPASPCRHDPFPTKRHDQNSRPRTFAAPATRAVFLYLTIASCLIPISHSARRPICRQA